LVVADPAKKSRNMDWRANSKNCRNERAAIPSISLFGFGVPNVAVAHAWHDDAVSSSTTDGAAGHDGPPFQARHSLRNEHTAQWTPVAGGNVPPHPGDIRVGQPVKRCLRRSSGGANAMQRAPLDFWFSYQVDQFQCPSPPHRSPLRGAISGDEAGFSCRNDSTSRVARRRGGRSGVHRHIPGRTRSINPVKRQVESGKVVMQDSSTRRACPPRRPWSTPGRQV